MARRRRRRRNPSGAIEWAKAHPYLTTFFIVPGLIAIPLALIRALRPPVVLQAPPAAPAKAGPSGAPLMPLDM